MVYIRSVKAIQRVKPFLDEMAGNYKKHKWKSDNPAKLSYQIHNGLMVARKLNIPMYAELSAKYTIKTSETYVTAELKVIEVNGSHEFDDITDVLEAIQKLVELGDTKLPINFPILPINIPNGDILTSWCSANNFNVSAFENSAFGYKLESTLK